MKISKAVETEQGTIQFEGELTEQETDLVLEIGLNVLLAQGAIPFTMKASKLELIHIEDEDDEEPTLQ